LDREARAVVILVTFAPDAADSEPAGALAHAQDFRVRAAA